MDYWQDYPFTSYDQWRPGLSSLGNFNQFTPSNPYSYRSPYAKYGQGYNQQYRNIRVPWKIFDPYSQPQGQFGYSGLSQNYGGFNHGKSPGTSNWVEQLFQDYGTGMTPWEVIFED